MGFGEVPGPDRPIRPGVGSMTRCHKCNYLGIMGPCPHAGEPFPIIRRAKPLPRRVLDVSEHFEQGLLDSWDCGEVSEDPEIQDDE